MMLSIGMIYLLILYKQLVLMFVIDIALEHWHNDVCIIYEDKGISNSGAPVQVMTLSERPAGTNQVRVIFEIENKGKGVSYLKDTFSGSVCLESGNRVKENKVNVLVSSDDDVTITCNKLNDQAQGEVRLVENKVILSCDIDTSRLQDTTFI